MTFQICWSTSYSSRLPFFSSSKAFAKCWFHLDFKYFSSSPFYSSFLSFHSQFAFRFPSNISNLHKLLCLCGFTFNSLKIQQIFWPSVGGGYTKTLKNLYVLSRHDTYWCEGCTICIKMFIKTFFSVHFTLKISFVKLLLASILQG